MYEKIKEICKKKKITISKLEEDLNFSQGSVKNGDLGKCSKIWD